MKSLTTPRNLPALDGEGNPSAPNDATGFVTLDVDSHYFIIPNVDQAEFVVVQILTDAVIAGTFTVEVCEFPAVRGGAISGAADVADHNEEAGKWVQLNNAALGTAQGSGVGWTVTVLSLLKAAGIGGAVIILPNFGSRRLRIKAAITTGGGCRVTSHAKGL